jgi:hypothetical protein
MSDDIQSINEPFDPTRTARTPVSINEPPSVTMPDAPVITGYDPYEAAIGGPDFTLVVSGTGFYDGSIIHFAGHDEPTTLTEDGELTTGVKPSLWLAPATVQLSIFNGPIESAPVEFVFLEAASRGSGARATSKGSADLSEVIEDPTDPDQLEDEIEAAEEDGDFVPTHGAKPKPKKRKR